MAKKYIDVTARFDGQGRVLPIRFGWEDGRSFPVDRVLDIRPAASRKAGGIGLRYTCRILGKERCLYYDSFEQKWFVEVPDGPSR